MCFAILQYRTLLHLIHCLDPNRSMAYIRVPCCYPSRCRCLGTPASRLSHMNMKTCKARLYSRRDLRKEVGTAGMDTPMAVTTQRNCRGLNFRFFCSARSRLRSRVRRSHIVHERCVHQGWRTRRSSIATRKQTDGQYEVRRKV